MKEFVKTAHSRKIIMWWEKCTNHNECWLDGYASAVNFLASRKTVRTIYFTNDLKKIKEALNECDQFS